MKAMRQSLKCNFSLELVQLLFLLALTTPSSSFRTLNTMKILPFAGDEEVVEPKPWWRKSTIPMTRYVARIAYDGTKFNGWQYQVKSRTIQLEVERALNSTMPPHLLEDLCLRTVAAGRTDAGVHARGQVIHFDLPDEILRQHKDVHALQTHLNNHLPPDVCLWNVSVAPAPVEKNLKVDGDWHAMYNSKGKLYTYRFSTRPVADPLHRLTRAHVGPRYAEMDMDKISTMCKLFEGRHDYQNFANRLQHKRRLSKKGEDFTTVRHVESVQLVDEGKKHYRLEVRLDGALQRMVRNMMGALWLVGRGDMHEAEFRRALFGDLYPTGSSPIRAAPAHGLTLEWVYYDDY